MPGSTTHETIIRDPELVEKAKLLKASPYFAIEGDESLSEKQLIFYVLAGIKPVSEVGSCHTEWLSPIYGESRGDDQAGVAGFLKQLSLHFRFKSPYDGAAIVSLHEKLIQAEQAIDIHGDEAAVYRTCGRLYGYPETAVEACVADWAYDKPSLLSFEEQQRIEGKSGLPREAFFFRFSKAHWQEELETVQQWYDVLKAYGVDHSDLIPKPDVPAPTVARTPSRESAARS
jgi:hypothetical protein